jgi:RHS repeat-associated protein
MSAPNYQWRYNYSPKASASYKDPEGESGTVTFTIKNSRGAVVKQLTSKRLNSGDTATVDLADASLADGWYTVTATASDGTHTSDASGARHFEISRPSRDTPGVGVKGFYRFEDVTLADRAQVRVNVANGNLLLRNKDLAIRGTAGQDLVQERVYNSQRATTRQLGRGWALGPAQQASLYHAVGHDGRDLVFEDQTEARWALDYKPASKRNVEVDTDGDPLRVHTKAATSSPVVRKLKDGTKVNITCYRRGERVAGKHGASTVWDQLDSSGDQLVADAYLITGDDDPVVPACDPDKAAPADEWSMPKGLDAKLERTGSGYRLTFNQDKHVLAFLESGRLDTLKDRAGNVIDPQFSDGVPLVQSVVDSQQRLTKYRYTADGMVDGLTDPAGRRTHYTYAKGNLTKATDLNGQSWTYEYTDSLTKVTDPRGNATRITYTGDGQKVASIVRVTNKAAGTGPTTRFAYYGQDACPQTKISTACTVVTDANGHATTYGYDGDGKVTQTYDALGHKRTTSYDSLGNVTSLAGNADGSAASTTKIAYAAGTSKVTSINSVDGGTSTFTYDDPGVNSPTKYTTPQGNALNYAYRKGDGNLASVKSAAGGETAYSLDWNDNGTLRGYSRPNLTTSSKTDRVSTSLSYANGNLTGIDFPDPIKDVHFTVDAYSRRTSQADGKGQVTRYDYDGLDRVTKITYADGGTITYAYDGNGNQTRRVVTAPGASAATTTYQYDALNRLVAEVKPQPGPRVRLTYDAVGNLTSIANTLDPNSTVKYQYNAVNLLQKLTDHTGAATTYTYDGDNNRTKVTYPNGVEVTTTYNKSNRVRRIKARQGSSTYVDLEYAYDKNSNGDDDTDLRTKATDHLSEHRTSYSYSKNFEELTKAETKDDTDKVVKTYSYGYDDNGHRTSATVDGTKTDYSYNAAGQVTKVGDTDMHYDANGNLTEAGKLKADYDARNNTTTVSGTAIKYEDKDQAQRLAVGSRQFLNTALGVSSYTDPGGKTSEVLRQPTGEIASLRTADGTVLYPVADAIGSIVALTGPGGARRDTYAYDPFGRDVGRTGKTPNPFRFTGEYLDASGVYKIGLRYYSPTSGAWTQIDPELRAVNAAHPPEANPYAYSGDDSINFTDPTGAGWGDALQCVGGAIEVGAGVAGVAVGIAGEAPSAGVSTGLVIGGVAVVGAGISTVGSCISASEG